MDNVRDLDGLTTLVKARRRYREEEDWDVPFLPNSLEKEAFYGLAGEIVRAIEPHTEADPVALLVQLLAAFGNVVGPGPHFMAEADRHAMNLFVVLVGTTAKGRKGSSWGHIKRLFGHVDPEWEDKRVLSGLSSGEGLIWAVRDRVTKRQAITEKGRVVDYQEVEDDPGISDKRLLVYEPEFASTLRVLAREGNTLSPVIRQAWDSGNLRTLTKNSPDVATGAHISIIGHITKTELIRTLAVTEAANGFANRFLWLSVQRSKFLPEGGRIWEVDFAPLVNRLRRAVEFARSAGRLQRDGEASELWKEVYPELSKGKLGLLGAVIARAEAQVMRLACLYALLDLSHVVRWEHLMAAMALWDYVEESADFIFGEALGDPVADRILEALRAAPAGLTKTEIHELFGRHRSGKEIAMALETLLSAKLVRRERGESGENGGRPVERWFAVQSIYSEKSEKTEKN